MAQTGTARLGVEKNPRPVFTHLMGMDIGAKNYDECKPHLHVVETTEVSDFFSRTRRAR